MMESFKKIIHLIILKIEQSNNVESYEFHSQTEKLYKQIVKEKPFENINLNLLPHTDRREIHRRNIKVLHEKIEVEEDDEFEFPSDKISIELVKVTADVLVTNNLNLIEGKIKRKQFLKRHEENTSISF